MAKATGSSGGSKTQGKKAAAKKSRAKVAKKPVAKKPAAKKAPAKKTAPKKAPPKKAIAKKTATKPATKKATSKKPATKKPAAKKAPSKPSASKKPATKKPAAKTPAAKKPATKKAATKAPAAKKPAAKAPSKTTKKAAAKPTAETTTKKTPNRKGITIVSKKPAKKSKAKQITPRFPPTSGRLLGPGSPIRRPLIPSGPSAPRIDDGNADSKPTKKVKSPFKKRELDRYRTVLLIKRAELIGDVSQMEAEALLGNAGDLSSLPQHLAEQGTDSYERSLSLDLAAADRRLIKEIDDAIARIDSGVFGVCERTGKPIRKERLDELPWARYSIEAARAMERAAPPTPPLP